jgi:hypothetical protein
VPELGAPLGEVQRPHDKEMYKARYLMENFSFKLKQYRSDRDPI